MGGRIRIPKTDGAEANDEVMMDTTKDDEHLNSKDHSATAERNDYEDNEVDFEGFDEQDDDMGLGDEIGSFDDSEGEEDSGGVDGIRLDTP